MTGMRFATILLAVAGSPALAVDFARDIQPVLAGRCYACHGPDVAESSLVLTSHDAATAETDSGMFAVVAGDAEQSEMIRRMLSDDEYERMPPEGEPIDEATVELFRRWIAEGAEYTSHWAFEPIGDPEVPTVDGVDNPIDAFIVRRLDDAGLTPAPPADRRTWLRRLAYDVTGLPPTSEALDGFEVDASPTAFRRRIDRSLASPDFGERWGRHWLDVVRYAETNSFERDGAKRNAWTYRDWVIDAINADLPYDRFVRDQIAGDVVEDGDAATKAATGYWRLGLWDDEPADPLQARYDELDDLVSTTSAAFMGLTMGCARCHDHKIDPIPQRDYYSMVSLVRDVTPFGRRFDPHTNNQIDVSPADVRERHSEVERRLGHLRDSLRKLEDEYIPRLSAPDQRKTEGSPEERREVLDRELAGVADDAAVARYEGLKRQIAVTEAEAAGLPPRSFVLGIGVRDDDPEPTFVLARGNPGSPTDPAPAAFPELFDSDPPPADVIESPGGGRRAMADWLMSPDHRLAARVIVNRVWQHHFGRGLVRSPNNFGRLGSPPTHPDLLDFLARRLIDDGWRLKPLHRMILTSDAYGRSSVHPDAASCEAVDPGNDRFWRFDPRRLSAEEIRDSILAVSGGLDRRVGGPSVHPRLSAEVMAGQSRPGEGWPTSSPNDENRRTVYVHVKRSLILPMLSSFDFPDPDQSCEARFGTLGPDQALALLNGPWVAARAASLSERIAGEVSADDGFGAFADAVIRGILRRASTETERASAVRLRDDLLAAGVNRDDAATLYVQSVLNWNEFLFVD